MTAGSSIDIVVPTVGRASLATLFEALESCGAEPERVIVVDDRPVPLVPLPLPPTGPAARAIVLRGRGRGPAAARNVGWREGAGDWVAFLDDDVVPGARWWEELRSDVAAADDAVAAVQGRVAVPLPGGRRPTDWERNVAGLEGAAWITADMVCRRRALEHVGGFDERFPRAYREDADLALRLLEAGYRLSVGERRSTHPVPGASPWVSVRLQAGNADDVLMRALHGTGWRRRVGAASGRLPWHLATAGLGVLSAARLLRGRPAAAGVAATGAAALMADFAWRRIRPGPRSPREVAIMALTSAVIPGTATTWWLIGWLTLRRRLRSGGSAPGGQRDAGSAADRPPPVRSDRGLEPGDAGGET